MIETFRLMRQVIIHPFNFYHDIQEPRRIQVDRWSRYRRHRLFGPDGLHSADRLRVRNTGALRNLVFARDRMDGSTMVDLEHLELGRQRHP